MRQFSFIVFCAAVLLGSSLAGCKKSDNPASTDSFVDDYTVQLTDAKGTVYSGDYLPLRAGYTCLYSGSVNVETNISIPGETPQNSVVNQPSTGMMKVLPLRPVPLTSGTVQLFPIVDLVAVVGKQPVSDTSRYFMKDTSAVYIKAFRMTDGSYVEVTNPVFVKSRLVVGDSWDTAPQLDMTKILSSSVSSNVSAINLTTSTKARFFVVGKEAITLPVGGRTAVRVEQANDISMSGPIVVDTVHATMTLTAKLATVYHLLADTGIVHQNTTGTINMSIVAYGETITIAIKINTSELNLTSLTLSRILPKVAQGYPEERPVLKSGTQEKFWNLSQAVVRTIMSAARL